VASPIAFAESREGKPERIEILSTITQNIAAPNPHLKAPAAFKVALLTGGIDRPYAFGLAMALAAKNVQLDVIGNDVVDSPEMHRTTNITFVNLWPARQPKPSLIGKVSRTLRHYISLIRYAAGTSPREFHILWNSKIQLFDRTLLMLYYKVLGKRVALTAHNVNQAKRDSRDTWLNRITLRIQYHLCDQIFVHTKKMKNDLLTDFGVESKAVTVIRHPINNAFPDTGLTPSEAKSRLGLRDTDKTILFFGKIKPYKGIEYLLPAFKKLAAEDEQFRLIIAGEVQKGSESYLDSLLQAIPLELKKRQVILKTQFIPDEEMEVYFKAADVLVLPYKDIFQSGVLFLGYSFGLPVIATDVGSFREEVVEGVTGYLCKPGDPAELANAVEVYFRSDLFKNLPVRRRQLKDYANANHSWDAVAELTRDAYTNMLGRNSS
jgi:D-inositol-3-phosphate glycosyltransferase